MGFARRAVGGEERVAVRVRHQFTLDEAVGVVLAARAAGCDGPPRGVGELSVRGVRAELKRAGCDRRFAGGRARSAAGGSVAGSRQVEQVRGQLVRLGMFPEPGADGASDYAAQEVVVEHQFTFAEAVAAVMATKPMVRPAPGRRLVPLTAREVRTALWWSAEHGPDAELADRWRAEPADGPLNRLAGWVGGELVRLGVFAGPVAERR
ncbi:hypothetical protein [Amycolatopsis sp. NPDC054798]